MAKRKIVELSPKIEGLWKEINDRDIDFDKLENCDFSLDEQLWFLENIDIKNNLKLHSEERYLMKKKIYERYIKSVKRKRISNLPETNLFDKIIESKHSDEIKNILLKKYDKLHTDENEENYKIRDYIETVIDLPTEYVPMNDKSINVQITKLMENLNKKIYGLNHVKENIIESYCAMTINDEYKKNIIALVGPPGVGKTAIASTIAESMNLPFEHISMGCVKDINSLIGHSSTYIGSKPGLFVELLLKMKKKNGVILLDELDKVSDKSDILSVLLHVLDRTQNNVFKDMYMPEINIDLSGIFFLVSLNDIELINPILRDRLSIIKIDGYDIKEKTKIGMQYILPKILKELNFNPNDIKINQPEMEYIIKQFCNENGVRSLEKVIRKICEKINVLRCFQKIKTIKLSYDIKGFKIPIIITQKHIDYLKKN